MLQYTKYDSVFPSRGHFPFDRRYCQEIETFRKSFDGILFIDRVLKALGVAKSKAYPPKTEKALRDLHREICDADMSAHHRLSIFYYILLDFDFGTERLRLSETFAASSGLPGKYHIFMKGLWHLDRQQFAQALEYIAHPSLIPDFADDVVTVLTRHSPPGDYSLPLAYYHTVQPILKTPQALSLLFDALARTSTREAFYFSRSHPEQTRELMMQQLVSAALDPDVPDQTAQEKALELTVLPFDADEERWFEEFLTRGEGRLIRRAREALLMRKISLGRYDEARKEKSLGGQWGAVLDGLRGGVVSHSS